MRAGTQDLCVDAGLRERRMYAACGRDQQEPGRKADDTPYGLPCVLLEI